MMSVATLVLMLLIKSTSSLGPLKSIQRAGVRSRVHAFKRTDGHGLAESTYELGLVRTKVSHATPACSTPTMKHGSPLAVIGLVLVPLFWSVAPTLAWSVDVSHGATLFQANCAGCHAGGQNFIKEKRTLQQEALEKFLGTTDPVKIQSFVQNGMPHKLLNMKVPMDGNDYLDVATFVSEQALGSKW